MQKTKTLVLCAMTAALSILILLIGGWIGVGTYAAPMLAGLLILPLSHRAGVKWQLCVWIAASLLGRMLVNDREEVLIYACLFGWYPAARPALEKLPGGVRMIVKLVIFNAVIIAAEALVMLVLVPEAEKAWMLILLLALGNITFLLYDRIIPRADRLLSARLGRLYR